MIENVICFKGSVGRAPKPPAPPTTGEAAGAGASARRSLAKRRGFQSTILTTGLGDSNAPSVMRQLLGSE